MKTLDWNVEMLVTNSNFLSYIENILNQSSIKHVWQYLFVCKCIIYLTIFE